MDWWVKSSQRKVYQGIGCSCDEMGKGGSHAVCVSRVRVAVAKTKCARSAPVRSAPKDRLRVALA